MDDQTKPDQPAVDPVTSSEPTGAPVPPPPGVLPASDLQPTGVPVPPPPPGCQPVPQPPLAGQPLASGPQPAGYYQPAAPRSNGKAIAALVCGIFAILFAWSILPGIIFGVVAIVLAVKAVKESGRDGKATGGKVCGIIGIVLAVITLVLYLMVSLALVMFESDYSESIRYSDNSTALPSSSDSPRAETEPEETKLEAAASAELDRLQAKDPAIVQQLAGQANDQVAEATDYGLSDLGIDPVVFVEWMLTDFNYQLDGAYDNGDGTGTAFADVTLRDPMVFATTFVDDAKAALEAGEMQGMDEAAVKVRLGEIFQTAMDKSTGVTTRFVSLDLVKVGDAWQVDPESWESKLDYLFGL